MAAMYKGDVSIFSLQEKRGGQLRGYLNVEETEHSGSFCRRYFILDCANKKLLYYMNSPEILPESWKNPVGEIYLQYVNKVADARKMRPKVPFCFVINVAGRQFFLQAENVEDMKQWIDVLNNASKISVPVVESCAGRTEWHAGDLSQTSYTTEIAGGVVCKLPIQVNYETRDGSEDGESQGFLLEKLSSKNMSVSRHTVAVSREMRDFPKTTTTAQSVPIKTGYAVKQGAMRKNWKRRYFTLHEHGLSYYKSELEKQPLRTIALSDIFDVRRTECVSLNKDNLFEIVTSKRTFYIQCDTVAEMDNWIHLIKSAVQRKKSIEKKVMHGPKNEEFNQKYSDDDEFNPSTHTVWV